MVAVACAIYHMRRTRRGHGRGRCSSHEEVYTNVNAGRGGYNATTSTTAATKKLDLPVKRGSNLGVVTMPGGRGGPSSSKEEQASGGGVSMTRLDDAFFSALPALQPPPYQTSSGSGPAHLARNQANSQRSQGSQGGRSDRPAKLSKRSSSGLGEFSDTSPRRHPSLVATEL